MPIYEYSCTQCERDFEKMVRFSDTNTQPECPHCHSTDTRKKISIFSAQGSGVNLASSSAAASSCGGSGRFT